jgi:uncharacterized protein (DUF2141 family)
MKRDLTPRPFPKYGKGRRILGGVAAALLCLFVMQTWASAQTAEEASSNRIEAEATNLRSSKGTFRCELYNSPAGFPKDDTSVVGHSIAKIVHRHASCVFRNVPAGSYAVAAMHDENGNGKMDYNFVGIPVEGYGFSDDPRVLFSAPSFDSAKFTYSGGVLKIPITLHY